MRIDKPNRQQEKQLRNLWKATFGDSEAFLDDFFQTAYAPDKVRCVLEEDKVIAALYWLDCSYQEEKIAYIYAVATDENYRGQGIGSKLLENTHEHLRGLGYAGTILVPAGEKLFDFYAKRGYQTTCYIDEFVCEGAVGGSLSIRECDKDTYAKLRRNFLSEDAVVQEGKNLDFLETQAKFYTDENFLMACSVDEKTKELTGIELLGDTTVAPFIVEELGCKKGIFRIPGNKKAFAMYHALQTENVSKLPRYFGFAYD